MNKLTVEKEIELPDSETATSFNEAVLRRQAAKEQIRQLDALIEECDRTMARVMDENGFQKVKCQGWTVSRREPGERRSIDPGKLLSLGVPAATIEAATKVTATKAGISVRKSEETDEFKEWAMETREKAGVKSKE